MNRGHAMQFGSPSADTAYAPKFKLYGSYKLPAQGLAHN